MFVNLLQKNTELANLFAYGIEGTDYELIDGKVSKINNDELFYEWMIYNVNISTPSTAYTDEFMEVYKNWDNGAKPPQPSASILITPISRPRRHRSTAYGMSLQSPCWQV